MDKFGSITARPGSLPPFEVETPPRGLWSPSGTLWKWTPGSFLYALVGFVLSLAGFVLLISVLALGVGTLIIWVDVPVLIGGLFVARGFAVAQCYLLRLTGLPRIIAPDWARGRTHARTWWARLIGPLRSGHYWMALLYGIVVRPVIALASFVIAVVWDSDVSEAMPWLLKRVPNRWREPLLSKRKTILCGDWNGTFMTVRSSSSCGSNLIWRLFNAAHNQVILRQFRSLPLKRRLARNPRLTNCMPCPQVSHHHCFKIVVWLLQLKP